MFEHRSDAFLAVRTHVLRSNGPERVCVEKANGERVQKSVRTVFERHSVQTPRRLRNALSGTGTLCNYNNMPTLVQ